MNTPKKLIEVALPLEAINRASAREKSIRHGHPSTLHLWWARRPLAAARAVIFAQMVDDPSSHPELFPTEEAQEAERQRLFRLIEQLVLWENTTNEDVLNQARDEIWKSWRMTCAANRDHPRAAELFNPDKLPGFHDPFAGGGSLPLEAQRLGLEAHASDLNPVAVLINKAMIEIPPHFAGRPPVNPDSRKDPFAREWRGAQGLAEDVRYYGKWMRDEAERCIGQLYPKVEITHEMAVDRLDLKPYLGRRLTVIAWLWARTVRSPNPAFADVEVPLISTFHLSSKGGKEVYVDPIVQGREYSFAVKYGQAPKGAKNGTKLERANFRCLLSGAPISPEYIRSEAMAGRMGMRLFAVIAESDHGRLFVSPDSTLMEGLKEIHPEWRPDVEFFQNALGFRVGNYGMKKWGDLFTARQCHALSVFSSLVRSVASRVENDLTSGTGWESRDSPRGMAYSEAVATYLGLAVGRCANYWSILTPWGGEFIVQTFGRQAVTMIWDFAEGNPFSDSTGNWLGAVEWIAKVITVSLPASSSGFASQADAQSQTISRDRIVSTDPPYYDNIGYADLSDFFYVWLRYSLGGTHPNLFSTIAVPKNEELVATPGRHGGKGKADQFFLTGMSRAMERLASQIHEAIPISIYYAFKQAESDDGQGIASTGWETFLQAVIQAGFSTTGTWPIRTERGGGFRNRARNSLASSIVLVCRPRPADAPTASRRDFISTLQTELPQALLHLQRGNIAPVDLAQAAIGPGMGIYTRYSRVLDAAGKPVTVREALTLINQVLDETLTGQEGEFDADSRWAMAWFDQYGFSEGEYGVAETLSKAKGTSVQGMMEAGILASKGGKVRLFRPIELPTSWDPLADTRLTEWEMVHHLIRLLELGGEAPAAAIVKKLGGKAEAARELCYRLYAICERKKRASEALSYNGLVQSWPEIQRLAQGVAAPQTGQTALFDAPEEEM